MLQRLLRAPAACLRAPSRTPRHASCATTHIDPAELVRRIRSRQTPNDVPANVSVAQVAAAVEASERAGDYKSALHLFDVATGGRSAAVDPNMPLLNAALRACTLWPRAKRFKKARRIMEQMRGVKDGPDASAYCAIIRLSGVAQDWGKAWYYFRQMLSLGIEPSLDAHDSLLAAAADAGEAARVWSLLRLRTSGDEARRAAALVPDDGSSGGSSDGADAVPDAFAAAVQAAIEPWRRRGPLPLTEDACLAGLKAAAAQRRPDVAEGLAELLDDMRAARHRDEDRAAAAQSPAWWDPPPAAVGAPAARAPAGGRPGRETPAPARRAEAEAWERSRAWEHAVRAASDDPDAAKRVLARMKSRGILPTIRAFELVIRSMGNLEFAAADPDPTHGAGLDAADLEDALGAWAAAEKTPSSALERNDGDRDGEAASVAAVLALLDRMDRSGCRPSLSTYGAAAATLLSLGAPGAQAARTIYDRAVGRRLLPRAARPANAAWRRRNRGWLEDARRRGALRREDPLVLDLHDHSPPLATVAVGRAFAQFAPAARGDARRARDVVVVTGRGVHSPDKLKPTLRPMVQALLAEGLAPLLPEETGPSAGGVAGGVASAASPPRPLGLRSWIPRGNDGCVVVSAADVERWAAGFAKAKDAGGAPRSKETRPASSAGDDPEADAAATSEGLRGGRGRGRGRRGRGRAGGRAARRGSSAAQGDPRPPRCERLGGGRGGGGASRSSGRATRPRARTGRGQTGASKRPAGLFSAHSSLTDDLSALGFTRSGDAKGKPRGDDKDAAE
jgi:pentatricopeptide repeat protein